MAIDNVVLGDPCTHLTNNFKVGFLFCPVLGLLGFCYSAALGRNYHLKWLKFIETVHTHTQERERGYMCMYAQFYVNIISTFKYL